MALDGRPLLLLGEAFFARLATLPVSLRLAIRAFPLATLAGFLWALAALPLVDFLHLPDFLPTVQSSFLLPFADLEHLMVSSFNPHCLWTLFLEPRLRPLFPPSWAAQSASHCALKASNSLELCW